jgi:hypothetical protein
MPHIGNGIFQCENMETDWLAIAIAKHVIKQSETSMFFEGSVSKMVRDAFMGTDIHPFLFAQAIREEVEVSGQVFDLDAISEYQHEITPHQEMREQEDKNRATGFFYFRNTLWRDFSTMLSYYKKKGKDYLSALNEIGSVSHIKDGYPVITLNSKNWFNEEFWKKVNRGESLVGKFPERVNKANPFIEEALMRAGIEPNPGPQRKKNKQKKTKRHPEIDSYWVQLFRSPRVPGRMMPGNSTAPYIHKIFTFTKTGVLTNGSDSLLIVEFKLNDMYDPEGAITGGQPGAFNTWMAIYNYFVVRRFKVDFTVNNIETDFSANCYVTLKDAQPGTTITTYAAAEASSRIGPVTPLLTLPPNNTMPRKISTGWMDVRTIVGAGLATTGLSFVGAANASPAQVIWASLVVYSSDAALFFGTGVDYTVNLRYDATLFSVRTNVA